MPKVRRLKDPKTGRVVHFTRRKYAELALFNHIIVTRKGPLVAYGIKRLSARDWVIVGREL